MVEGDDGRGRDQDAPVAVEGQEGQGAEDVEVGLDPPPAEVDQQRTHEHLPGRDDVSGDDLARPGQGQGHRQGGDRPAQQQRRPDVDMDLAGSPRPGPGGDQQGDEDRREPLESDQPGEQGVGAAKDGVPMLAEQRPRPAPSPRAAHDPWLPVPCLPLPADRWGWVEQRASEDGGLRPLGLPPEQPGDHGIMPGVVALVPPRAVIPPWKTSRPVESNRSTWPDVAPPNRVASVPPSSSYTRTPGMAAAACQRSVRPHASGPSPVGRRARGPSPGPGIGP